MKYRLLSRIAGARNGFESLHTHHIYDNPYNAIKDACDIADKAPHLLVWVSNEFDETLFTNEPFMPCLATFKREA